MKIKKIIYILNLFIVCFCLSLNSYGLWVPDAWNVYPEEFYKIYDISSKYTTTGMDLSKLTVSNFKGHSYNPTPMAEGMQLDFLARQFKLDSKNEDVVGWIYVPKTNINYPVVQHLDNDFYVNRNYERFENKRKEYGFPGVVWVASMCKFKSLDDVSENTVFHGHNWENYKAAPEYNVGPEIDRSLDIMFSQLNSFHNFDYAKERPYIYVSDLEKTIPLKIFAVFYAEDEFHYHNVNLNEDEKLNMLQEVLARSRFNYNSNVYLTDKIFTFYTCTRAYGRGREDQKFVIMARPLRDDESVEDVLPDDYITIHKGHKEPTLKKIPPKK